MSGSIKSHTRNSSHQPEPYQQPRSGLWNTPIRVQREVERLSPYSALFQPGKIEDDTAVQIPRRDATPYTYGACIRHYNISHRDSMGRNPPDIGVPATVTACCSRIGAGAIEIDPGRRPVQFQ